MLSHLHVMRWPLVFVALAGCETYDLAPPKTDRSLAAAAEAAEQRMHQRYVVALDLETAVARSDIDRAHHDASLIDSLDEPEIVDRWRPLLDAVRDAAHRVVITESLDTAAMRVAALGQACAHCHEAMHATVRFAELPTPIGDTTLADAMARHQTAGLEMWEGVIGPNDALWQRGASELSTMRTTFVAQLDDIGDVARIKLEAAAALEVTSRYDRATVFARMLSTCARCHAAMRDH